MPRSWKQWRTTDIRHTRALDFAQSNQLRSLEEMRFQFPCVSNATSKGFFEFTVFRQQKERSNITLQPLRQIYLFRKSVTCSTRSPDSTEPWWSLFEHILLPVRHIVHVFFWLKILGELVQRERERERERDSMAHWGCSVCVWVCVSALACIPTCFSVFSLHFRV